MITAEQAAIVKGLLARGDKQHDIAAFFGENPGRVADIAKGRRHKEVKAAPKKDLPSEADLASGEAVHKARQALLRARLGIDAALSFLDDYEASRDGK